MPQSLVIVESPGKTKTISRYLGKGYRVESSLGHVRDLPQSSGERFQRRMTNEQLGIDPENGWSAKYEIIPGKEKQVSELARLASSSEVVYLATDLDREGEAIAWHLQELLSESRACRCRSPDMSPLEFKRVVFGEITKGAIAKAFERPGVVHQERVNAQQARRFLDRVVGFRLSELLRRKVGRGMSAGRVQSVAVRMIVEREREIRSFLPEEYWEATADLRRSSESATCRFKVATRGKARFRPGTKDEAEEALRALKQCAFHVAEVNESRRSEKPRPPFITSTLQQTASSQLGFSGKKTMLLAQRLYEAGLITYMRTDSTNLSADAIGKVRNFIERKYGIDYLPANPNRFSTSKTAQEAHEAIRPTDAMDDETGRAAQLERDQLRLYELIRRRFVSCQMSPAQYKSTTVTVHAGEFELSTKGRVVLFDGFTRVLPARRSSPEDQLLPEYQETERLTCVKADTDQHFTRPKPRYSEASLIRELDSKGIGRPSTFNAILSKIEERGYVKLKEKRFHAERMGELVTDRLCRSFTNLMDYEFTQDVEKQLDAIANGDADWKVVLDEFYANFKQQLELASQPSGMPRNPGIEVGIACEQCKRPMRLRTAKTGVFLGCSGFALPAKERCKSTMSLQPSSDLPKSEDDELQRLLTQRRCDECGCSMLSFVVDERRMLHLCSNTRECQQVIIEHGQFTAAAYDGPVLECDKCGAEMHRRVGRFGSYFACTKCKNTRKIKRNGEVAAPKEDPIPMPELSCEDASDFYILRDGEAGIFLAASKFPKIRKTRAPKVKELIPHGSALAEKYKFLLSAPQESPEGEDAVVRWSRKNKEHYVTVAGKQRNAWMCVYRGGAWHDNSQRTVK